MTRSELNAERLCARSDDAAQASSIVDGRSGGRHNISLFAPWRELIIGRLQMRTPLLAAFALAAGLSFAPALAIAPAHADPAYKAGAVADFFAKAAMGKSRSICFGTAADCPAPPPSGAAAKFDLLVNFEFNSDKLTQAARENLDQFAKALRDPRLKGEKFEIDGHTDATGAELYNLGLSERRASSVVAYLASQGLDPNYLVAKGFGKTKPRVADPYSAENRRVETRLLEQ
jgi:outer membrane protein OmpA-like peptidoglycan-associated protein